MTAHYACTACANVWCEPKHEVLTHDNKHHGWSWAASCPACGCPYVQWMNYPEFALR